MSNYYDFNSDNNSELSHYPIFSEARHLLRIRIKSRPNETGTKRKLWQNALAP